MWKKFALAPSSATAILLFVGHFLAAAEAPRALTKEVITRKLGGGIEDPYENERLNKEIAGQGPSLVPVFAEIAVSNGDPVIVINAFLLVVKYAPSPSEYRELALRILAEHGDKGEAIPYQIFQFLSKHGRSEDCRPILDLIGRSSRPRVRLAGARVVAQMGDERALATLKELLAKFRTGEAERQRQESERWEEFRREMGEDIVAPPWPSPTPGKRTYLDMIDEQILNMENRLGESSKLRRQAK